MKKKQMLVGLGAVAIVAGLSNQAKADEATKADFRQPETTKKVVEQVAQTPNENDVKKAKNEVDKANSEVEDNQKVVDGAKKEQETALKETNNAENEVKKAQEIADKATPSEIKNAQENVGKNQATVNEAEKTLENSKQVDQKAQEAINAQQKNVTDATKQVEKEKSDVETAKSKVKEAESAFDSKTLLKAQQDAGVLEEKVQKDQEEVNALANEVTNAKNKQKDLVESGNKTRSNLEADLKNAGDEYLTKIITHELERKEVPEYESKTSPKEEKTFVGGDGKTYYTVANEDVDFDGEKTETIVMKSEEDYNTPHVVDYKKVSEEVRKYLIELRKINGIDIPVPEVTDKALKYAKARSDEMIAKDELSHDTKLKKSDFGLRGSTENASAGTLPEKAIESEKELAYNLILRYFNDYSNASAYGTDRPDEANRMNYGHRIPLLSASGTGIAVGSSFDKNSQYGNYGTLQFVTDDPNHPVYPTVEGSYTSTWHLAKAENKDSDPDHSEFYYNGKRVKFLPKTTFVYVWNETTHPKNPVYAKAKEALDTFNTKQAKDEATISQKLATLNAEYDTAKNILEKDRADLKNANDRVADLTKDNEEKVKTLKLAQSELAKQNDELVNAQTDLEKQESELRRLKTVKENTFNLVKEAEKTLTKAKTELEKAQQYVSDLQNAPKNLEVAKKHLLEAQQKLNVAQKNYDEAVEKLNSAKAQQEEVQKKYLTLSKEYDKYIKDKQEAELQEKLKREYNVIVSKGLTPVAVTDTKGKIVAYKVAESPSKTAVQRNKAVYGAKGLVLPQTGDQTRETLAMASVLAITALGFVKLKRKEN